MRLDWIYHMIFDTGPQQEHSRNSMTIVSSHIRSHLRFSAFMMFLLVVAALIHSVPSDSSKSGQDPSEFDGIMIGTGYLGENLSHPGGFLTIEYPFSFRRRSYIEARFELGGYLHPRNSWALLVQGGIGFGTILSCGFYTGLSVGLGYVHTFLAAPLYAVLGSPSGNVSLQIPDYGQPGFLVDMTGRIGWDWGSLGVPMRTFVAFKTFGRLPYNGMILPHFALQAGVAVRVRTVVNNAGVKK